MAKLVPPHRIIASTLTAGLSVLTSSTIRSHHVKVLSMPSKTKIGNYFELGHHSAPTKAKGNNQYISNSRNLHNWAKRINS